MVFAQGALDGHAFQFLKPGFFHWPPSGLPEVTHSSGCRVGPSLAPHSECTSWSSWGRFRFDAVLWPHPHAGFIDGPLIKTRLSSACCTFEHTHLSEAGFEGRVREKEGSTKLHGHGLSCTHCTCPSSEWVINNLFWGAIWPMSILLNALEIPACSKENCWETTIHGPSFLTPLPKKKRLGEWTSVFCSLRQ